MFYFPQYESELGKAAKKATKAKSVGLSVSAGADLSALSGDRLITLKGDADPFTLDIFGSYTNEAKQKFVDDGWNLVTFQLNKGVSNFQKVGILIRAKVENSFSVDDARIKAIQLLSQDFNNVSLVVAEDETYKLPTKTPVKTTQPSNVDSSSSLSSSANSTDILSSIVSNPLASFGAGLGISTPVVLLAGGIVLYLALKK